MKYIYIIPKSVINDKRGGGYVYMSLPPHCNILEGFSVWTEITGD